MQITVADISHWQGAIDWDTFSKQVDAVVIKVSGADGGGLYTDSAFTRNRDEARRTGLPRWFYHYKGSTASATDQAAYMLHAIGGLQPGEAIVLDDENAGKIEPGFIAEFADAIKQQCGLGVVVYSNLARWQGVDLSPLKARGLSAWVAKYGVNDGTIAGAGNAPSGLDVPIVMWQYTSQAHGDGVSANTVDFSLFFDTVGQFSAYGAKASTEPPVTPQPAPAPSPTGGSGVYSVVSGDTLSGIGKKLSLDWRVIASTNGIVSPYTIFPGQKLKVYGGAPGQAPPAANTYTVVSGDTLSGIGTKTGHNWQALANLNNLSAPYTIFPGQVLKLDGAVAPSAAAQRTYTVVRGDSLSGIGNKTSVAWQTIASLNGIKPPYTIYPNQVLKLNS